MYIYFVTRHEGLNIDSGRGLTNSLEVIGYVIVKMERGEYTLILSDK